MNSSNALSLPAAILVFLGGLGGGVLGSLIFAGAPARPEMQTHDSDIVAITAAIQQLSRDVRLLAEHADSRGGAATSAAPLRETALPESRPGSARGIDNNEKLILAIERLTASLAGRGGSSRAPALSVNVGTPIPAQQKRAEMFNPILQLEYELRSQKHHFMTYQQVIDLYGMPDVIGEHSTGVSFDYNIKEGTDEHAYLQFRFMDGFCIRVDG